MEGHRLRVGTVAWSSSLLSSGSRDKSILQRDIRAQDDFSSKLSGHKLEVRLLCTTSLIQLNQQYNFFVLTIVYVYVYTLLQLDFFSNMYLL